MITTSSSNHVADMPQTPRSHSSKSHDDGDVKYFFQRPEQDLNSRQNAAKWAGDDSAIEQVNLKRRTYKDLFKANSVLLKSKKMWDERFINEWSTDLSCVGKRRISINRKWKSTFKFKRSFSLMFRIN